MFKEELKKYVESSNLVNMKPAGEGIFVLKYKKRVFYDNLWNEYIAECRGSIVDADFNLVAYPFTKIYNYGIEKEAPVFDDSTQVTAFRKVSGFMVAVSYHNNDVLVSTTGSTSGDFVEYAKEMMLKHMPWADWQMAMMADDCRDMTFMFECVHPSDPHIVVEKPGMYILGYREKTWGSKVGHDPCMLQDLSIMFNCFKPESVTASMAAVKNLVKTVQHEGFVFYDENGVGAKIKSPYYLTAKWVARNPRTDKLMTPEFREQIDEEYYPLLDAIRENIVAYTALDEQARLDWVRNYMESA